MSIYEPAVNLLIERKHISRLKAICIIAIINLILSVIVLASFTGYLNWTIIGKNLFDFVDYLTGSYTLGLMILVYCIFMGWKIWPQICNSLKLKDNLLKKYFNFLLKFLGPLILLWLFVIA